MTSPRSLAYRALGALVNGDTKQCERYLIDLAGALEDSPKRSQGRTPDRLPLPERSGTYSDEVTQ